MGKQTHISSVFCSKLEDFTPKKRLSGDLLLNLLLADHHLPFLSSFYDSWNSTSQRRSKMVGIEITVLLLGEVKLIHIKKHESMLAVVKNVDG